MKSIKILKNRSDIGAGTRGSDMGIDALEIAAINMKHDFLIFILSLIFLLIMKQFIIKLKILQQNESNLLKLNAND